MLGQLLQQACALTLLKNSKMISCVTIKVDSNLYHVFARPENGLRNIVRGLKLDDKVFAYCEDKETHTLFTCDENVARAVEVKVNGRYMGAKKRSRDVLKLLLLAVPNEQGTFYEECH